MSRPSTIAQAIREAALYANTPDDVSSLNQWLPPEDVWEMAAQFCRHKNIRQNFLYGLDEVGARTFLLIVAEALE